MQLLLDENEVAEIKKKLLDHDRKLKQLYPIIEELVEFMDSQKKVSPQQQRTEKP
jgi:hypothetical protein